MVPTFDHVYFHEVCDTTCYGSELACAVIDVFIESSPVLLSALIAAVEAQDADSYRRLLHEIRGSASAIGGIQLTALCHALEQSIDTALHSEVMNQLRMIRDAHADLVTALREEHARSSVARSPVI